MSFKAKERAKKAISISGAAEFAAAGAPLGERRSMLTWAGYAGLWAALASSALFFGASAVLDRYQAQPQVSIALSDWAWLSSLKIRLDRPAPVIPDGISTPAPFMGPVQPVGMAEVAEAPPAVHKAPARPHPKSSRSLASKSFRVLARIRSEVVKSDRLTVSQAKAIAAETVTEAERMRNLSTLLRGRFFASLDIQPTTVIAVADPVPAVAIQNKAIVHRAKIVAHPKKQILAKQVDAVQATPPPAQIVITSTGPASQLIAEQRKQINGLSEAIRLPNIPVTIGVPRDNSAPGSSDTLTQVAAAPMGSPSVNGQAAGTRTPTISISVPDSYASGTLIAQADSTHSGYSTQFGYSSYPHITVTTQAARPAAQEAARRTPSATPTTQVANPSNTPANTPVSTHVLAAVAPKAPTSSYVEGFEWTTPVTPSDVESISNERGGAPDEVLGWDLARAENHWPTLIWKAGFQPTRLVPLISNNALFFLANLAQPSVKVQSGAGIVFGKVAAGWSVELSGRAERPVFLTTDNKSVGIGDTTADRYFAFLNVEPGAHLVYLMDHSGTAGVVALPTLSGVATYADVSQTTLKTLSGHVYDGGSAKLSGLSNVQVRVVGQQNAKIVTGPYGDFRIDNVTESGNFPLVLETDASLGATHRYRVVLGQEGNLTLIRLRDDQVNDLVDQLEGGVSPDSGMVVTAAPQIVDASLNGPNPAEGLFPSISSLIQSPTLRPETYTMDNSGQLEVNTSLTADAVRFVSVQVPDGPAVAKIENKSQATLWSELIFAQARIINILGPY